MAPRLSASERIAGPADGVQAAPSTSRFVEAGGLRLHYLDYGTAGRPPMLCAHGGGANAHWFDFVASGFNADYHVRALDHRGHGDSAWADPPEYSYQHYASELAEAVEKLDLRDFVLIGHSMGGKIALAYAATYPGRVSRLVIVDSNLQTTEERLSEMRDIGARPGKNYATREEFAARFRLQPEDTTAPPEIIRHLARNSCMQLADGRWRHKFDRKVFARHRIIDGMSCWNRIKIPALLVKGELSHRVTPEIAAAVKAHCAQVDLVEVARSYHHVTLDNPSGFTHAVRAFLAGRP